MIPLNQIQVPQPCGEDWDVMDGDTQRRFCAGCRCHVHDLSAMTAIEAQGVLDRADGRLCVRFQTRPDGTVLTQDAPPSAERRPHWPRRLAAAASWALALTVTGLGLSARADTSPRSTHHAASKTPATPAHKRPHVLLGKIAAPRPLPVPMPTMGIIAAPKVVPPKLPVTMGAPPLPPKKQSPT